MANKMPKTTAKEKHKAKLIEYLADPENEIPKRAKYPEILGISDAALYQFFRSPELSEIEAESNEIRRKRLGRTLMEVDRALKERAISGDPQAIKLLYQRFEGWSEKTKLEHEIAGIDDIVQDIEHG